MVIVVVVLVLGMFVNAATASAKTVAEHVVIRTYDTFGVPSARMQAARAAAFEILRDAQIGVDWLDCGRSAVAEDRASPECGDGLGARELVVRIVAAGARPVSKTLGYALVDVDSGAGTIATLYADRIGMLALDAGADEGTLLGRALAHEIGHLLLGTNRHAHVGLMRPEWIAQEFARGFRRDWQFSKKESVEMRRQLAARERAVPQPAAIVAHLSDEVVRCPAQTSPSHACVIR